MSLLLNLEDTAHDCLVTVLCLGEHLQQGRCAHGPMCEARCMGVHWPHVGHSKMTLSQQGPESTFVSSAFPLPNCIFIFSFPATSFSLPGSYSIVSPPFHRWSTRILEFGNVRGGRDFRITHQNCLIHCQETEAARSLGTYPRSPAPQW